MTTTNRKYRKRDILILSVTIALLVAIAVFCAVNWHLVIELFDLIVRGKEVVREYVLGWGIVGEVAIGVVLIFCFFFPFISSLPLQILCVMVYDVWHATLLIGSALAVAAQLLFLLEKNLQTFFYSKKQREKQHDIELRIKNSSRNIHLVMVLLYVVPCIPFLIISSVACRSKMKWWKYTLYTVLGPIPEIIVTLVLGDQVTTNSTPIVSFIILLGMILLVVLSLIYQDKMIYFIFKPAYAATCAVGEREESKNASEDEAGLASASSEEVFNNAAREYEEPENESENETGLALGATDDVGSNAASEREELNTPEEAGPTSKPSSRHVEIDLASNDQITKEDQDDN